MKASLFRVFIVSGFLCGCGRPAVPSGAVRAPATVSQWEIRRVPYLRKERESLGERVKMTNALRWEMTLVQIPLEAIERHGLLKLFDVVAEKNDVIFEEIDQSPLMHLARRDQDIVMGLRSGVCVGACTSEVASNLLVSLKDAGADIAHCPQMTTAGRDVGKIFRGNTLPIFTAASTRSNQQAVIATNLSFGQTITVQQEDLTPDGIILRTVVRSELFEGYARDLKEPRSKPNFHPPIFDLTVFGTRANLRSNEVLMLGSPINVSVRTTVQSVPKLSDVPVVGRFFTKVKRETNYFRTVLLIRPGPE